MRIDTYLFQSGKFNSRTKASEAISRGEVLVNGKPVKKSSFEVSDSDEVSVESHGVTFVSNGGYKLEKAFEDFKFSANNLTFADIGASTGGFTDCLLKHGASKVFAIDVGESLLSVELKNNPKVKVIDNFNARNLTEKTLGGLVDGVVCDVSFISLTYILPQIFSVLKMNGFAVCLIKPQFECGKKQLNKNGIVTDKKARREAICKVIDFAKAIGFSPEKFTNAPIKQDKNREYLILLSKDKYSPITISQIENLI